MKRKFKVSIILCLIAILLIATQLPIRILNRNKVKNGQSIPILMYHSISKDGENLFKVNKDSFYKQMKYLKDNGYKTLSLDEVYQYIKDEKKFPQKSVVITFDDGYRDNYVNAYPILKQFGLKATVFVITNTVDKGTYYMNSNELKEINFNNMDVQSHTTNHSKLNQLKEEERHKTLKESKNYLENLLGKEVRYIAYPYGRYNKKVIEDVKASGYKMAVTTRSSYASIKSDFYKLNRINVSGYTKLNGFRKSLNSEI
ncbi:polysaccharide deacetylase family protein [Clostridium niameyense]|uniref:polysaccharide deacetylase family protein n=1 Tax=Clostridium niameyense TaxID=1622073 RepID=UPI00067EEB95|nr:polysaccharide deacetylase family protein [Clostridium niameyense]